MLRTVKRRLSTFPRLEAPKRIGIVAEHQDRVWERRTPLVPSDIKALLKEHDGLQVFVQPSAKRCFTESEYQQVGAKISEDLSDADIILGVKEISPQCLTSGKTYAFFSHTHKGQDYNLGLLDTMLKTKSRYIDWELLTDDQGQRTTAFGWYAGAVGMIDGLSNFGEMALLGLGIQTPFLHFPRPYAYPTLAALKKHLRSLQPISIPSSLQPLVITVLGRGRVSQGACAMLEELGVTWVKKKDLSRLKGDKLYACQLQLDEYLCNEEGKFDRKEYEEHPERYKSLFADEVAPYTSILLNGAFWAPKFPRVLSKQELERIQVNRRGPGGLLSIIDVSCDFNGGIEIVNRATTIDRPVYYYDQGRETDYPRATSTQVFSIEILPTELPKDSSAFFSERITPYLKALLQDTPEKDLHRALQRATLVENGSINPKHDRKGELQKKVASHVATKQATVLILGSGLVARPAAKLILDSGVKLIVATNDVSGAKETLAGLQGVQLEHMDAQDFDRLDDLVRSSDVVISLLPASMHQSVVDICLKRQKHFVNASYTGEYIKSKDEEARKKGCIILTEMGLDPGIDHMSAMRLFDQAESKNFKIDSFISFCGGLPSPEAANVPFGYKFSWAPRGALVAMLNSAKYRLRGSDFYVTGKNLLKSRFSGVDISRFTLEGLPNRDSLDYLKTYTLDANLQTMLRGTLRYQGFSRLLDGYKSLGLLNLDINEKQGNSWTEFLPACIGVRDMREARQSLGLRFSEDAGLLDDIEESFDWLVRNANVPFKKGPTTLDTTAFLMQHALKYKQGERDLCILHHEVGVRDIRQNTTRAFTSTLVAYGDEASPAMAKTVGETAALGALLILDGKIRARGLVLPTSSEVWRQVLPQLEARGIKCVEQQVKTPTLNSTLSSYPSMNS